MAKYKVKTAAVIDRHPVGSTIELNEATAKALAKKGYVTIIGEVAKPKAKKTTKKKAETQSKPKAKADKTDDKK